MAVLAEKMRAKGVQWHVTGIGMGVRTAKNAAVVHYLEGGPVSCAGARLGRPESC